MVQRDELKAGWRVLVGTILAYLMCYPPTVLLVVPGLTSVNASDQPKLNCLTVNCLTIFMNTAGFSVNLLLKKLSHAWVAALATSLQVAGLAMCALNLTGDAVWTILGLGVLVGSGLGITFMNNIIISTKTFPRSITTAIAIAMTTICLIGSTVPKVVEVLQNLITETDSSFSTTNTTNTNIITNVSNSICNTTNAINSTTTNSVSASDEERKCQLLLYTALTCIGFLGALLMKPPKKIELQKELSLEEETARSRKSRRKTVKVERVRDQMKALIKDPLFDFVAIFNSCCFSISLYLHSQAGKIYEKTLMSLWKTCDEDERIMEWKNILKTIFIATHAFGYILFAYAGYRLKQNKTTLYHVAAGLFSLNILSVTFICNQNEIIVMALLVLFTIVSAIGLAGVMMLANLLYMDYYVERFPAAVNLGNVLRGVFALLIYPLRELVTYPNHLYLFSGVMITLIILWNVVELVCRPKSKCCGRERSMKASDQFSPRPSRRVILLHSI